MGAGSTSSKNQYKALLERYKIIKEEPTQGLLFLREQDGTEYVLREWTFNDKREYDKCLQNLERKKQQLSSCKFVSRLQQIVHRSEDQYCSTFYKVYTLFPYSQRTLENEIAERNLQKRRFQQNDLWSILASCVLGLAHLQRNSIKHECLRSSTILISPHGIVKIFDPIAIGCQSNYDSLISRRNTPHLYLSPQLTQGLQRQSSQPACNPYKSDIFTLAMIILEAGLGQYQDECYRDECSRVHWETVQYHLHRFRQTYSEELAELIQLMLSREEKNRPDWLQLEERAMKEDEGRTSLVGKTSFGKVENVNAQRMTSGHQTRGSDLAANLPAQFITSQVVSQHTVTQQETLQPKHNHLYSKPTPKQPVFVPYINHNQSSFNTSNLQRNSSQIRQVPVLPSYIESTRPLRSVFPNTNYSTSTKVDQNLVVVNEQERTANTPNNHHTSSQLDQSVKDPSISAGYYSQPPSFYNTFTPIYQPPAPDLKYNSQGVSFFESEKRSSVPQGQYVVQRYKQGSEYKGYKFEGMRHGIGTFYYQDGGMYEGDWQYNKMAGKGKLFYQSGKLAYEGGWANDQFQGEGILYNQYPQLLHQPINYRNLDQVEQYWTKYEGKFHEDLKSGRGILFLSNGQYFQGQFREDAANGSGIFIRMNGQQIAGRWLNNSYVG